MTPLLRVFDMLASLKFYCEVLGFGIGEIQARSLRLPTIGPARAQRIADGAN